MRKLAFAVVLAVLLPVGARSATFQQYGPTERIPNSDAMNFYPRWLGALNPDPAMDLSGQPTTATIDGRAVCVDSRNNVHTIDVNRSIGQGEIFFPPLNYGESNSLHVAYQNDKLDARRFTGFSDFVNLDSTWASQYQSYLNPGQAYDGLKAPTLWVDSLDQVHAAWVRTHYDPNFSTVKTTGHVYYARKVPAAGRLRST